MSLDTRSKNSPLRICHVDSEREFRGGQQALLTLAAGLKALGHEQSLVCPSDSELRQRAEALRLILADSIPSDVDIVHTHSGKAQNTAWWRTLGKPVVRVVTRHVAFAPKGALLHRLKYTYTCDGVIAVSESVRERLIQSGVPEQHIAVIPTGVALPSEYRRTPGERFTVGHLGAFTEEKGQSVAVDAALLAEKHIPGLRMILGGEGPLREAVQILASQSSAIETPGFLDDKAAFFAGLDVFLMPSKSEAWGLAALEAMAHGVPVIASDIGGLREIVKHEETGWLVPANDARALAGALIYAFQRREALDEMGQRARDRAAQFTIEATAQKTEQFYRRLLSSRQASSASDRRT